ncbi:hypothetical protein BKA63DRAFT_168436 [Paraphoma chrysanthemicola]|nr:hypothetical protein BKA63DRAFT_168436 [Paraphoma chrysanthemicola]
MSMSSALDDDEMPELEEATPLNTLSPSAVAAVLMQNLTLSPGGSPQPVAAPMPSQQGDGMATPGSSSNLIGDNSTPSGSEGEATSAPDAQPALSTPEAVTETAAASTLSYPEEFLAGLIPILETPTPLIPIPAPPFLMSLPVILGPNGLPAETTFAEAMALILASNPVFDDHAPRFDATAFVDSLEQVDISTIPAEDMKCPHCWLPFGTTDDDDPSFVWAPDPEDTPELAERNAALRELPFCRANNDPVRTPCGHIVGRDCLIRSMEEVNTLCPTCRQELLSQPTAESDDETDNDGDSDDEEGEGDDDDYYEEEQEDDGGGNGVDWEAEFEDVDVIIDNHGPGATQNIAPHDNFEEAANEYHEDDAGDDSKDSMANDSAGMDKAGNGTGV